MIRIVLERFAEQCDPSPFTTVDEAYQYLQTSLGSVIKRGGGKQLVAELRSEDTARDQQTSSSLDDATAQILARLKGKETESDGSTEPNDH